MIEANRWKLGIFIIVGVSLILGGILFFGVSQFLVPKVTIMTIFRDSVDGLQIGSPVKYSGVNIGSVSKILIRSDGYVTVKMDLNLQTLDMHEKKEFEGKIAYDPDFASNTVRKYVKDGYRCILQLRGITGEKYISIKHFSTSDSTNKFKDFKFVNIPGNALYIPSVPSLVSGAADNISEILEKLSKVNILNTAQKVDDSLDTVKQLTQQMKSLILTIQGENVNTVLLHTAAKLDTMVDAVTELCNNLARQPNSIIRGNDSKEYFSSSNN
jgi:phospholipid/cholesterol/gamma-HCH transport system substrate-binding protein